MEKLEKLLPDNYEIPQAQGNYFRFQDGINRVRILGSAITGYEYFNQDNKPVRSKEPFESTPDIKKNGKVKVFWAFPIWNYQTSSIQIMEITQKTIMNDIKGLINNEKWGDPVNNYDLAITKTGEGLDTEYSTVAEPPVGETSEEIMNAFMEKPINLEALYEGDNPFEESSIGNLK